MADYLYSSESSDAGWDEESTGGTPTPQTPRFRKESTLTQATPASLGENANRTEKNVVPNAFETPTRPKIMRAAKQNLDKTVYTEWDGEITDESSDEEQAMELDTEDDRFVTSSPAAAVDRTRSTNQSSFSTSSAVLPQRPQLFHAVSSAEASPTIARSEQAQRMELGLSEFQPSPRRLIAQIPQPIKNWGEFRPLMKDAATQTEFDDFGHHGSQTEVNNRDSQTANNNIGHQDIPVQQENRYIEGAGDVPLNDRDEFYEYLLNRRETAPDFPMISMLRTRRGLDAHEAYLERALAFWTDRIDIARRNDQRYCLAIALNMERQMREEVEEMERLKEGFRRY